jgi:hypothetical protein
VSKFLVTFDAALAYAVTADYKVLTAKLGDSNVVASATYQAIPGSRSVHQTVPYFDLGSLGGFGLFAHNGSWRVVILVDGKTAAEGSFTYSVE